MGWVSVLPRCVSVLPRTIIVYAALRDPALVVSASPHPPHSLHTLHTCAALPGPCSGALWIHLHGSSSAAPAWPVPPFAAAWFAAAPEKGCGKQNTNVARTARTTGMPRLHMNVDPTLTDLYHGWGAGAVGEWRSTFSQLTLPAAAEGFVHVSVVSSDVELYTQLNYLASLPSPRPLPSSSPLRSRASPQRFPGATASSPRAYTQRSPQRSHAPHEGEGAAHPPTSTSSPLRPTAEPYMPGGSAQAAQAAQAAADGSADDSRDGGAGVYVCVCVCVCVCMRDVKEEHTRVHVLSAFLRAKDEFDQRERSEFPSNRRISAYVRVVVLGVLRRTVFWAEKPALPCVCVCVCDAMYVGLSHRWLSPVAHHGLQPSVEPCTRRS